MEVPIAVIFLGTLIFFAHFFNIIFDRTKVPNALWFLCFGMLLGPVFGVVSKEHFGVVGSVFTNITLIIILFESGINLKLNELGGAIGSASLLTLVNFIVSSAVATGVAYYCTDLNNLVSSCFFGVIVGGTSSAVVIPIIKQLKINQRGETILLLESALSDVLCLVIGLALLSAMSKGIFSLADMLSMIWKSFLIAIVIGIAAGLIWFALLDRIRKIQNSVFTNLAMVFICAGLTDLTGLNGGIETLAFAVTLGNAHLIKKTFLGRVAPSKQLFNSEKKFIAEIAFILQTYFFVYVGVSIKFGKPMIFVLGLLVVLLIVGLRPFAVRLFVREKMSFKDLAIMGVMSPKGLVPAILASIPTSMGIAGGDIIQDLAYSTVIFSIVLCSILVIILSADPFALGYLKGILFGGSTDFEQGLANGKEGEKTEQLQQDSTEVNNTPGLPSNKNEKKTK